MAAAKKCDRCGTFYDSYTTKLDGSEVNGIKLIRITDQGTYFSVGKCTDLCKTCLHMLHEWLNHTGPERV